MSDRDVILIAIVIAAAFTRTIAAEAGMLRTITKEEIKENMKNFVPGEPLSEIDYENGKNLTFLLPEEVLVQSVNGSLELEEVIVEQTLTYRPWPNGVVPYVLSSSFATDERAVIARAITEMQSKTCVGFIPRTNQADYVTFTKSGWGCYTNSLGVRGGAQILNLARPCMFYGGGTQAFIGTTLHEMMHTLGFIHEQSRSDRDTFVIINFSNIQPSYVSQFQKLDGSPNMATPYDFESLMHYPPRAFAINPSINTITARDGKSYNMGQRTAFTSNDIRKIRTLYKCDPPTTTTTTTRATTIAPTCGTAAQGFARCLRSPTFGCNCVSQFRASWLGARFACLRQGFQLANPSSSAYRTFLTTQLLAGRSFANYWVDLGRSFSGSRFSISGPWRIRSQTFYFTLLQNPSTSSLFLCSRP